MARRTLAAFKPPARISGRSLRGQRDQSNERPVPPLRSASKVSEQQRLGVRVTVREGDEIEAVADAAAAFT